jgi:hypothetical protein
MNLTPKQKKIAIVTAAVAVAAAGIYFYTRKSTLGEGLTDGGATGEGLTDGATGEVTDGGANQLLASAQTAKYAKYQEDINAFGAALEAAKAKSASAPRVLVPSGSGTLTATSDADGNLFYGGGRSVAIKANTPVSIALTPQTTALLLRYADGRPIEQKQATITAGQTVNVYFGTSRPKPRVALRIMTPYGLRTIASVEAP